MNLQKDTEDEEEAKWYRQPEFEEMLKSDIEILDNCEKVPVPEEDLEGILKALKNIHDFGNYMFKRGDYWDSLNIYRYEVIHFDILGMYFIEGYDKYNYTKPRDYLEKMITDIELPFRLQHAANEIIFGKYEEALESSNFACFLDFNDVRAHYQSAICLYGLKRYQSAYFHIVIARQRDRKNEAVLDVMSKIRKSSIACKATIRECDQIINSHTATFEAYISRGKANMYLEEDIDCAISDLEQAKKLHETKKKEIKSLLLKAHQLKIEEEKSNTKCKPKINCYQTEGNPEDYDVDKVLEALGEIRVQYKPKKKKNKKKVKQNKKQSISNGEGHINSFSKTTKNVTTKELIDDELLKIKVTDDLSEIPLKTAVVKDHVQTDPSKEALKPIQEYIDSIESENRSLKVAQQFYNSMVEKCKKMEKKLENISESEFCKICFEENSCMVFIPCGHVMTCENCSYSCKNCAICRQPIKSKFKIYFS